MVVAWGGACEPLLISHIQEGEYKSHSIFNVLTWLPNLLHIHNSSETSYYTSYTSSPLRSQYITMAPAETNEVKRCFERRAYEHTPLPREEILLLLRYKRERKHFDQLGWQIRGYPLCSRPTTSSSFHPDILTQSIDQLHPMNIGTADDCCNKTAPFYCFHVPRPEDILTWLHRRWMVPWRSHIEWGQFIAKIIIARTDQKMCLRHKKMEPKLAIDWIIHLNALVCQRSEEVRQQVVEEEPEQLAPTPYQAWGLAENENPQDLRQDQTFFLLRPLFRAVAVLIQGPGEWPPRSVEHHNLDVYVIRTGVTQGLSAPIPLEDLIADVPPANFDTDLFWLEGGDDWVLKAVKTTLPVAYDFLDKLQRREDAAFGQQPDPVESTKNSRAGYLMSPEALGRKARELGWKDEWDPPSGPSAEWVPDGMTVSWAPEVFVPGPSSTGGSSASRAAETH